MDVIVFLRQILARDYWDGCGIVTDNWHLIACVTLIWMLRQTKQHDLVDLTCEWIYISFYNKYLVNKKNTLSHFNVFKNTDCVMLSLIPTYTRFIKTLLLISRTNLPIKIFYEYVIRTFEWILSTVGASVYYSNQSTHEIRLTHPGPANYGAPGLRCSLLLIVGPSSLNFRC